MKQANKAMPASNIETALNVIGSLGPTSNNRLRIERETAAASRN